MESRLRLTRSPSRLTWENRFSQKSGLVTPGPSGERIACSCQLGIDNSLTSCMQSALTTLQTRG
jgi:hypothetical protein